MIGIGIVLYKPDIDIVKRNLEYFSKQDCRVLLVSNSAEYRNRLEKIIKKDGRCGLIHHSKNTGVAKAYNEIMDHYDSLGIEWVLTLDQDTVCNDDFVEKYVLRTHRRKVGIICPGIKYTSRNGTLKAEKPAGHDVFVNACISSGSMISVRAWKDAGGFDGRLFIDFVDFDFCYAVREAGYRILCMSDVFFEHSLGNLEIRRIGKAVFRVTHHSPERKYYYIRNAVICHKKHKRMYGIRSLIRDIMHDYVKVILFERPKLKKLAGMNRGLYEGMRVRYRK